MTKRTIGVLVSAAVLAMAVVPASAAVYTVGTGGTYAGDWAGLQSAIDDAAGGANEVRILGGITISRPTSTTGLTRASGDASTVTISGGWDSGFSAQTGGATVIDAAQRGRSFDLQSPTILASLTIQNGLWNATEDYGIAVRASAQVQLSHLTLINNTTARSTGGGAIDFTGDSAGSVLEYTQVLDCYGNNTGARDGSSVLIRANGTMASKILVANCELLGAGGGVSNVGRNDVTIVNTLIAAGKGGITTSSTNQGPFRVANSTFADVVPGYQVANSNVYDFTWQMVNSVFSDTASGFYAGTSSSRDVNFAYSTIDNTTLYGGGTFHYEGTNPTSDPLLAYRPVFVDKPTGSGSTTSIVVADSSLYAVNGYVEVVQAGGAGRGVARQIASIPDATHIVLAAGDALASNSSVYDVVSYWAGSTNVTGDYNLTAASTAQIDAGGRLLAMTAAEKLAVFGEAVAQTVLYLDLGGKVITSEANANYNDGDYDALTDVIVDLGGYTPSAGWNLDANGFYTDLAYVTDLAGNARVVGGAIDMGAYEYAVPEPATVAFLALGGLGMAAAGLRRRRKA